MANKTLKDLAEKMGDIDFCMMSTRAASGALSGRPMSNNGDVEYAGDSWFFSYEQSNKIGEIERDSNVGLSFAGSKGLLGKPPIFIAVEGDAELIRDKAAFAEHWQEDLDRWFPDGIDTPGIVLIRVHATRIHYWDGEDEGDVPV